MVNATQLGPTRASSVSSVNERSAADRSSAPEVRAVRLAFFSRVRVRAPIDVRSQAIVGDPLRERGHERREATAGRSTGPTRLDATAYPARDGGVRRETASEYLRRGHRGARPWRGAAKKATSESVITDPSSKPTTSVEVITDSSESRPATSAEVIIDSAPRSVRPSSRGELAEGLQLEVRNIASQQRHEVAGFQKWPVLR